MPGTLPERLHCRLTERSYRVEPLHARLARRETRRPMLLLRLGSKLAHIPQNEHVLAGLPAQNGNGCRKRGGIGVVGIIENKRVIVPAPAFETPRRRLQRLEPGLYVIERCAGGERGAGGRQRVQHIVLTWQ